MNSTIHPIGLHPLLTVRRRSAAVLLWLAALCGPPLAGQQIEIPPAPQTPPHLPLAAPQQRILERADEILKQTKLGDAQRQIRLQVLKAILTGTVIRPSDDYPEIRNPKFWSFASDAFVVAPETTPVEAIDDLWVAHENDGVPVPRIRCYKYSSLILIEGFIQYFRETNNLAGLAALNQLIGHREIPGNLPNGGDDLLWEKRQGCDNLLPGDQIWVDNPFFERGADWLTEENYQQALRQGLAPAEATAAAAAATESQIAGEEGSNIFYLGDGKFIRGAGSLSRLCRESFKNHENPDASAHQQVFTTMIYTLTRFQEHMIDDNYTAQACMRAKPGSVRLADFRLERVRSPIAPDNLLRMYPGPTQPIPLDSLIDAIASHNKPPRLVKLDKTTVPIFGDDYSWPEQQRVRSAIDAMMRIKSDDSWWLLQTKIHDDRYVLTATRDGVAKNFTLGALCSDIIDARLCLGFTTHLPLVPGQLPTPFQPELEYWQQQTQWAAEAKPLYAMQAALCQRALDQWQPIQGTLPGGDGRSHIFTADEKARFVALLKKEIADRNQTRTAACEDVFVPMRPAPGGWEGFDAELASDLRAESDRGVRPTN